MTPKISAMDKCKQKDSHRICEICRIKERRIKEHHFFAGFPRSETRCKEWLKVVGRAELICIPIEKLHRQRHVCGKHFKKQDYTKSGKSLKKKAIPSLHLSRKPLADELFKEFPMKAKDYHMSLEHNYVNIGTKEPVKTNTGTLSLVQHSPSDSQTNDKDVLGSLTGNKVVQESQTGDIKDEGQKSETDMDGTFDFNIVDDDVSEHDIGELYYNDLDHDHDYEDRPPTTASQFIRNYTVDDDGNIAPTYQPVCLQDYCRSCLSTNTIEMPGALSLAFTRATGVSLRDVRYPRRLCARCAALVRRCVKFQQAARLTNVWLKDLVDKGMVNRSSITSVKRDCSKFLPELQIKLNLTNHFDAEYSHGEEIEIKLKNTQSNNNVKPSYLALETLQTHYDDDHFDSDDYFVSENMPLHTDATEKQNIDPNSIKKPVIDLQKQGVPINTGTKLLKLKPVTNKEVISELSKKIKLKIVPYGHGLRMCEVQTVKRPLKQDGVRIRNAQNKNKNQRMTPAERESKEIIFNEFFETEILSIEQQMEDLLKRKETPNYINATFKCGLCFKGFSYKKVYLKHLEIHSEKRGPLSCTVCHTRFSSKKCYWIHLRAHKTKLHCKRCNYETRTRCKAWRHIDWHNGVKHTCDKCGQTFPTLLSHARHRHPSDSACGLCGQSFLSQLNLKRHTSQKHKLDKITIPPDGPRCSQCDVRFVNDEALLTHLQVSPRHRECRPKNDLERLSKRQLTRVTCEQCGETVITIKRYVRHFKEQHPDCTRTQFVKTVLCHLCGKTCQTPYFLKLHMNVHTQAHQYTCDHCGKTHTDRLRFLTHMKKHSGIQHPCLLCPKVFKTCSNLHRHKTEFHSDVRKHKCEYCEKSFKTREKVKRHTEFVHLEKPRPKRKRTQRKPSAAEPSPKRSRRDRQSLAAAIAACTQYVLQRTGRAIEGDEIVIEKDDHVIESEEQVIESEDHVIESEEHVIESEEHVIESEEYVIESEEDVIETVEEVEIGYYDDFIEE